MAKRKNGRASVIAQWKTAKEHHPGMMLLFRMGDFYELFGADAEIAARVLGLTLTSRSEDDKLSMTMAGFPHHQLESHLATLLADGQRVAVCEQVGDDGTREVKRLAAPDVDSDASEAPQRKPFVVRCKLCGKPMERNKGSSLWHCTDLSMGHRGLVPDGDVPRYETKDEIPQRRFHRLKHAEEKGISRSGLTRLEEVVV